MSKIRGYDDFKTEDEFNKNSKRQLLAERLHLPNDIKKRKPLNGGKSIYIDTYLLSSIIKYWHPETIKFKTDMMKNGMYYQGI